MDVIARPRGRGKTTDLIRRAAAESAYIICPDRQQATFVFNEAQRQGLDIPFPITWAEFTEGRYYGRGINGFLIDNLDMCVQSMTAVPVVAVSVTVPEGHRIVRPVTAGEETGNQW